MGANGVPGIEVRVYQVPDRSTAVAAQSPPSALVQRLRAICLRQEATLRRDVPPGGAWAARSPPQPGQWILFDCLRDGPRQYLITRLVAFPAASKVAAQRLTMRERLVAQGVANGEGLKAVAHACSVSVQAVSTYLDRAKRKLGVTSHAELVRSVLSSARSPVTAPSGSLASSTLSTPSGGASFDDLGIGQRQLRIWSSLRVDAQFCLYGQWFRSLCGPAVGRDDQTAGLTQAELDILVAMTRGMRNAKIASARGTSERTVASQVSAMLQKSGATSRSELIASVLLACFSL